jgi:hypothetical protein
MGKYCPLKGSRGAHLDCDRVIGDDLDRPVVLDVHNAAAHGLAVGEVKTGRWAALGRLGRLWAVKRRPSTRNDADRRMAFRWSAALADLY